LSPQEHAHSALNPIKNSIGKGKTLGSPVVQGFCRISEDGDINTVSIYPLLAKQAYFSPKATAVIKEQPAFEVGVVLPCLWPMLLEVSIREESSYEGPPIITQHGKVGIKIIGSII
jgi:hypothetical protein